MATIPRSRWPLIIVDVFFPCFQCRPPNFLANHINVGQAGGPMLIYIFSFPKPPLPKEREGWLLSVKSPGDESRLQDSSLGFGESVFIWLAPCVSGRYELIWLNSFTLPSKGCVYTDQMQQKKRWSFIETGCGQSSATDIANESTANIPEGLKCFGLVQILSSVYTLY